MIAHFVTPDLLVCDQETYTQQYTGTGQQHVVVHAAKEPYHRAFVGYRTPGAPKDSPEYLWAERGRELALNLVDAPRPEFFSPRVLLKGLEFLWEHERHPQRDALLIIHCNEGKSRAPGLALLYLALVKRQIDNLTYQSAERMFQERMYPEYEPGEGLRQHFEQYWHLYQETLKGW